MPTITRKKFPIDPSIPQVTIPAQTRMNLCESAGLDYRARSGKAFLGLVGRAITWHSAKIARLPQRSQPAHTIAALKPIAELAADLARRLNPENLPVEVSAELDAADVMTGAAHRYLLDLAAATGMAVKQLTGQGSRGVLERQLKEARQVAMDELAELHHQYANEECDANDLAEFLATCELLLKPKG
jgi:hypothetical protein